MRPFERAESLERAEPLQRKHARRRAPAFRRGGGVDVVVRQTYTRVDQHPHVDANDHGYAAQVQVHQVNALQGQRPDGIVGDFDQADGEHQHDEHRTVERTERHPKLVPAKPRTST